jgi:dihydropteroate synthase
MGVLNLTPDSFSDGGQFNSLENAGALLERFRHFGVQIVDVGAESTAPMNASVGAREELARLEETLFPLIEQGVFDQLQLSIDTFRPETFEAVYRFCERRSLCERLIWNDVSGQSEDELLSMLKNDFKLARYIYCHSAPPSRERSGEHMSLPVSGIASIFDHFKRADEFFGALIQTGRIWYDPCFGFSKKAELNWELLRSIPQLSRLHAVPWVIGLSKKSFLRASLEELNLKVSRDEVLRQSELLHIQALCSLMGQIPLKQLILRVHDPLIPVVANIFLQNSKMTAFSE